MPKYPSASRTFKEPILFTHRGISGPGILQISSYWRPGQSVSLRLLPDIDWLKELKHCRQQSPERTVEKALQQNFSRRLAKVLCEWKQWKDKLQNCSNARLEEISHELEHLTLKTQRKLKVTEQQK